MRAVALAILATSLSQAPALAADYDPGPLRGTAYAEPMAAPVVSWEGPYVGGFGGYAQTNFEFKGALRDPAARILRDLAIEQEFGLSRLLAAKSDDARSTAYGAFAGYNSQFEDVVLGVELDYTHARMIGVSTDSIGRSVVRSNGYFNSVDLSGLASANLNDYGSLRARLGYVTGPFMPFVTGGMALGDSTARALSTSTSRARTRGRQDVPTWNSSKPKRLARRKHLSWGSRPALASISRSRRTFFCGPSTNTSTSTISMGTNSTSTPSGAGPRGIAFGELGLRA